MSTIFYKFFLRAQFFVKVICCGKFHPAVSAPKAAKRYRTQKRARRRCCPTTHTGETTKAVAALARHPSQDRPRLKSSRSDKRPPHRAYHKNNRSIKNAARRTKRAAARRHGRKKQTASRKNGRAAILRRARMRRHTENPSADFCLRRGSVFQKIYRRRKPVLPYTSSMMTCSAASPRRLPRDTMRV